MLHFLFESIGSGFGTGYGSSRGGGAVKESIYKTRNAGPYGGRVCFEFFSFVLSPMPTLFRFSLTVSGTTPGTSR